MLHIIMYFSVLTVLDLQEKGQFQLLEERGWTKVLMSTAPDSSMAHCVSADLQMSGGITPAFKKLCGGFKELKKQGSKSFLIFLNTF